MHNDHLGRPEYATSKTQQVVWKAYNYAYGRSVLKDDIGGLNIGFPGQYYDGESGLWYNGFRDYDAICAERSDWVGGGMNTYYGPAGRVASTATGLVAGYATGALTKTPTLYGGFVEVTTVSYGSKGGYSVDYKMTDRSGNTVIEDSVEKYE